LAEKKICTIFLFRGAADGRKKKDLYTPLLNGLTEFLAQPKSHELTRVDGVCVNM
jgi:hypothetical protein